MEDRVCELRKSRWQHIYLRMLSTFIYCISVRVCAFVFVHFILVHMFVRVLARVLLYIHTFVRVLVCVSVYIHAYGYGSGDV